MNVVTSTALVKPYKQNRKAVIAVIHESFDLIFKQHVSKGSVNANWCSSSYAYTKPKICLPSGI